MTAIPKLSIQRRQPNGRARSLIALRMSADYLDVLDAIVAAEGLSGRTEFMERCIREHSTKAIKHAHGTEDARLAMLAHVRLKHSVFIPYYSFEQWKSDIGTNNATLGRLARYNAGLYFIGALLDWSCWAVCAPHTINPLAKSSQIVFAPMEGNTLNVWDGTEEELLQWIVGSSDKLEKGTRTDEQEM